MSGQSLLSNANGIPARAFTLIIGENMYYVRKAFDIRLNNNDPAQKLILIALATKAGCNGKSEVTPEEIAEMCEISLRDTISALHQLKRSGLISQLPGFFCVYQLMF